MAFLLFGCSVPAVAAERPNVLFIMADDLRPELGCYGHPTVQSPNLDKLASKGMRFDRAYVQVTFCNPSRTSLLTGLCPDTTKVLDNRANFRDTLPDVVTLPQHFRNQGYFTAGLGKVYHGGLDDPKSWDVAKQFQATPTGTKGEGRNLTGGALKWCRWLAAEGTDLDQADGQIAAEGIKLIEAQRNKPFFIALGFHKPHDPFVAPKKYFDLYPPESVKLHRDPTDATPAPEAHFGKGFKRAFDQFTDKERLEFQRAYYAGTSFTDAQIGKVLDVVERLNLWKNTIVIFWGDHGYHLGERGWWNKSTLFEPSCRMPMIVWAPGMKAAGKPTSGLVEALDIYPTLCELAVLKAPSHLHGTSFDGLLNDPRQPGKKAVLTQVHAGRSVRTNRWRYTEWNDGKAGVELYDHETDPSEWHNLAGKAEWRETIQDLRQLLRAAK